MHCNNSYCTFVVDAFSCCTPLGPRQLGVDVHLTFEFGSIIFKQPRLPDTFAQAASRKFGQPRAPRYFSLSPRILGTRGLVHLNSQRNVRQHSSQSPGLTHREGNELVSTFGECTKRQYDSRVAFPRDTQHNNDVKRILFTGGDLTRDFVR